MKCLKRLLQGCICAATAISLTSGIAFAAESKERTTTSVAKVGDTYYDSLAEAVNAIETEGTIELVKDAEVNMVIDVFEEKIDHGGAGESFDHPERKVQQRNDLS